MARRNCFFELDCREERGAFVIGLRGRVDPSNFRFFQTEFEKYVNQYVTDLVVDLSGAEYICTSCWALLLRVRQTVTDAGDRVVLVVDNGKVEKLMNVLGFTDSFDTAKNLNGAMTLLKR